MRRLSSLSIAVLALASACQAPNPAHSGTTHTSAASPAATATATANAKPASPTAAQPTLAPPSSAAAVLKAPATPTRTLEGVVTLAASGLAAQGATIIGSNGANVAVLADNALLSNNGGSLVDAGGSLLASGQGNLIPTGATTGGAAMLAQDDTVVAAGSLISDNAGSLVSNNAGSIIANHAAGRRVLDVASTANVPVAGMLVSAVSLKTREYLPLGVDADGKQIYTVLSDLKGGYKLYLPADAGNVVIAVSAPPRARASVNLNALTTTTAAASAPVPADEDTNIATRLMRKAFIDHLADFLTNLDALPPVSAANPASGLIISLGKLVNDHARLDGIPQGPDAARIPEVHALAQRLVDIQLGQADLSQLTVDAAYSPGWTGSKERVYDAMVASFRALRDASIRYAATQSAPAFVTISLDPRPNGDSPLCAAPVRVSVADPSNLGLYALDTYLHDGYLHSTTDLARAFEAVAVPAVVDGPPVDDRLGLAPDTPNNPNYYSDPGNGERLTQSARIQVATLTIGSTLALAIGTDPSAPLTAALFKVMDDYSKTHSYGASPAPQAVSSYQPGPCVPVATPDAAATAP